MSLYDTHVDIDPQSVFGAANAMADERRLSGHVLWMDATANVDTLATPEGVDAAVRRARDAGVNTLVVDVKPISGEVVYASRIAPRLRRWKGRDYDPSFDRLAAVLEAGHRYGLSVAASVNVFSEGHRHFSVGPAYARPEWQCVAYGVDPASQQPLLRRSADAPWEAVSVWVSPHNAAVREYEMSLVDEIVRGYPLDGFVFDRMRYAGLTDDFSDAARRGFEAFLGRAAERWPEDVYEVVPSGRREGPLYRQWLEFRATTIRGFLTDAAAVARAARPDIQVGAYVGSWYGEYHGVGVNWASPEYRPDRPLTPDYPTTGYADRLDWLMTGCYYPRATRAEAIAAGANPGATVESAAALSNRVTQDATVTYGSLYLMNYEGDPAAFTRAVRVCKAVTQGAMIFDMVYLDRWGWWDVLRDALEAPAAPPHCDHDLRERLRPGAGRGTRVAPVTDVPISETP